MGESQRDSDTGGWEAMTKYEALLELRKIYASPLLDLILKAKLKEIIKVLESTL